MDDQVLQVLLGAGLDLAVVIAIAIIAEAVKRLDPDDKWKRWYVLVPLGLGLIAGVAMHISRADSIGVFSLLKAAVLYAAGASYAYSWYKAWRAKQ